MSIPHPPRTCPLCGYESKSSTKLSAETGKPAVPTSGDVTVCVSCASINRYTADMTLEVCPLDFLAQLSQRDLQMMYHVVHVILTANMAAEGNPFVNPATLKESTHGPVHR